eukprot:GHVU01061891.1.p1 GENE.GHVU01061891.1~~GHVU01061891.1.p1  ORF type:complete len:285 (+),score=43.29 GHVU01061891.1:246-1100(+)
MGYSDVKSLFVYDESWTDTTKGVEVAEALTIPIFMACIAYIPTILLLRQWVLDRKPIYARRFNVMWNGTLSFFSGLGLFVMVYKWDYDHHRLFRIFVEEDVYTGPARYVEAVFALTKCVEFGDTLLLVLRKKTPGFLHVYHHITVTLYCWHAQYVNVRFAHLFCMMNMLVHFVMYSYYALTGVIADRTKLRWARPHITRMQLLQMAVGVYVSICALHDEATTARDASRLNAQLSVVMYSSYAFLFAKFYCDNYWRNVKAQMYILFSAFNVFLAWVLLQYNKKLV